MPPLRFICTYRTGDVTCGQPAPRFYIDGGDSPRPLCAQHAEEYRKADLRVEEWPVAVEGEDLGDAIERVGGIGLGSQPNPAEENPMVDTRAARFVATTREDLAK